MNMKNKKRLFCFMLAVIMLVCTIPSAIFAGTEVSYVALGDSISYGDALANPDTEKFVALVKAANEYTLTDNSMTGETSATLLAKFDDADFVNAIKGADVITITIGGNDVMNAMYDFLAVKYNEDNEGSNLTGNDIKNMFLTYTGFDLINIAIFAINAVSSFVESDVAKKSFENFETNFETIITKIKTANPNAEIIVANQYNPYLYAAKDAEGTMFASYAKTLSDEFEDGLDIFNKIITDGAQAGGYHVVDTRTAFKNATSNPCNASFTTMNIDFHPNKIGHEIIANLVNAKIATLTIPKDPGTDDEKTSAEFISMGDITKDGIINAADLSTLLGVYGTRDKSADLNGDNIVNAGDLTRLLSNYGLRYEESK